MKNLRTILWLAVAVVLLLFAHVLLTVRGRSAHVAGDRTSLVSLSDEAVTLLKISRPGEPDVVLSKAGHWCFVEPFSGSVDLQAVNRLVDALAFAPLCDHYGERELLRLGRTRADFSLAPPRFSVSLRAGDTSARVGFGSPIPSKEEVYVAVDGEDGISTVPSNVLAAVDLRVDDLRRRALFLETPSQVSAVDIKRGSGSFLRFARAGEKWSLVQPQASPAAADRVRALLESTLAADAVDFVWPVGATNESQAVNAALLAGYGLDPESAVTVTFKFADGADRQVSYGKEAREGLVYALVQNQSAIVTVPVALKDQSSAEAALFTDTRLFPLAAEQVNSILVADGPTRYLLACDAAGRWRLDAPVAAPADQDAVRALLDRLLSLKGDAVVAKGGVGVSLSTNSPTVVVNREAALGDTVLEGLRSREIVRIARSSVKRLVVMPAAGGEPTAVIYDRDRRAWNVESSVRQGTVDVKAVEAVLGALDPLTAIGVVSLKVSAAELRNYGLDKPSMTLAVDTFQEGEVRRNVLVGGTTDGGAYATLGSSDAVFILPLADVEAFSTPLVSE